MSYVFLYILMMFAFVIIVVKLRLEIKNYKKNYYSTKNKAVIKINSYSYLGAILVSLMFIHLALKDWSNLDITKIISNISFLIMIILFIINIPIEYKNESRLYFYEEGISLPIGKLISDLKLISYDNIEDFHFEEYSKNKFWLEIKPFKSKRINYRMNKEEKEKIISFVKGIRPEYKIKTTKEYKD